MWDDPLMSDQPPPPHEVAIAGQLYAIERTAGQDLQRLDFTIFSILLAYISVTSGWMINAQSIDPVILAVLPLPAVGMVAYLVQLMDLAKARSRSIDHLEEILVKHANLTQGPPIGSAAEKSVTDIAYMAGPAPIRFLRALLSFAIYAVAILGSLFWVGICLVLYLSSPTQTGAEFANFFSAVGTACFGLNAILVVVIIANIFRVFGVFAFAKKKTQSTPAKPGSPTASSASVP